MDCCPPRLSSGQLSCCTHYICSPDLVLHTSLHHQKSAGSSVFLMEDAFSGDKFPSEGKMQWAHNARITCMRLFSNKDTWFQSEAQNNDNVLVTSSSDWTIRLWWKGRSQRCLRGRNGPVTTLADKLLGDSSGEVLASGGQDGTVRLWSLGSSGKRGKRALKTTLHGHEKPVTLLSVPGHNPSLLVSVSKDAKVRVWDTSASSGARSSGCVGMACVHGALVGIKCHEALCYIAAGSSVTAIDLRTMRKVSTAAIHQPKLYSFESLPSKSLICTGGDDKTMLWDIRKNQEKPKPVAIMDGHSGYVAHIHMDPYKIVTGGPEDLYVKVWETDTGILANSFTCCIPDFEESSGGLLAMSVKGCRIVTSSWCLEPGLLEPGLICFRDFTNASNPLSSSECSSTTKFWESEFSFDG
ncbi:ribosome biogenesis protein YTM1-like isoform X2 [Magnolia sinica]|uniref:ribosome biogenesis protein YTM1-like isoform X2 n=1 Tax=Magnolia sinica TaxID=86752 RepID=UPI0026582761|nr:ribosome biogenesis protein YTM1-like isoform X2 [Magnolia sinica]